MWLDWLYEGRISCNEDVKEHVEGGKRRKGFNNKKEVPSSCPELLNGATLTKSTWGQAIEDVVSN